MILKDQELLSICTGGVIGSTLVQKMEAGTFASSEALLSYFNIFVSF